MGKKTLTVSIAAYNVEKFLENTLKSLEISELLNELEVFVIDDGGKDGSLEIARHFQEKYPDTIHAIHKENGGYGSTVAYSIAHATGKYFKLLDGDDWFDKEGLLQIIKRLRTCEADIIKQVCCRNLKWNSHCTHYIRIKFIQLCLLHMLKKYSSLLFQSIATDLEGTNKVQAAFQE